MRKLILVLTCFLFIIVVKEGQALNKAFLESTVLISYKTSANVISSGTGFLVFREVSESKDCIFLVTNKHVLPLEGSLQSINIRVNTMNQDESKVEKIDICVVGENGKYLPIIKFHPNEKYDITAIDITDYITQFAIKATWIPYSLFVTKEKLKTENISVGDEVFFLGYPDAIYDPRNVFPIVRIGIISTVPSEGYIFKDILRKKYNLPEKIDGFLMDANVFPGSSGSIVILKPQAATVGPKGGTIIGGLKKTPYLLGIISGSIPIYDTALDSKQRMGLGIVYSADAIKETIESFFHQ